MKNNLLLIAVLLSPCYLTTAQKDPKVSLLLGKSIQALGGTDNVKALKTVKIKGTAITNLLEQSERPDGPWIINIDEFTEIRDIQNSRLRRRLSSTLPAAGQTYQSTLLYGDGVWGRAFGKEINAGSEMIEDPELYPETILFTALSSENLKFGRSEIIQGTKHDVIQFTFRQYPVELYINSATSLPTGYQITKPVRGEYFFSVWGDNEIRTYFSFWSIQKNGVHYPKQIDIAVNNQPWTSIAYESFEWNVGVSADSLFISDQIKNQFREKITKPYPSRLGSNEKSFKELKPGVLQIQGNWNVSVVDQGDGIVILEAPISSDYSSKVINEVKRRFPGKAIKAVISTSDAWPHLGGVREYIARGISVHILDVNRPIIQRLIQTRFSFSPDSLERRKQSPQLQIISSKTLIGAGANRIELYPYRTETGERMMMAYFPEHRLLYISDLGQGLPTPPDFMIQYFNEVVKAVEREQLAVDEIFAMHMGIYKWSSVKELFK